MENIALLKEIWFKKEVERLGREGISKADMSRSLDIKPQYLNSVLNGSRGLADSFLDKFIEVFNINQFDLFPPQKENNMVDYSIALRFLDKLDEKDAENKRLSSELQAMAEEIGNLKAQIGTQKEPQAPDHPPLAFDGGFIESFTSESSGGSVKDSIPMRSPTTSSKKSSAAKT